MKMTLHIDEGLLDKVTGLYGCESKTAAVDLALKEMARRHALKSYAEKGLGFTAAELRDAVDPNYDLTASRAGSSVSKPVSYRKSNGRRGAR
jgi:Arc/MetJ family transcription regulator